MVDKVDKPDSILGNGEETQNNAKKGVGVFVRDFNVWVRDSEGEESQLTTDGTERHFYKEEALYLSPDKKSLVAWHRKVEADEQLHLIEVAPKDQLRPKLSSRQYLRVGDDVAIDRPRLYDLAAKKEIPTKDELFNNPWDLTNIGWSKSNRDYLFIFNERGHQHLRLIAISTDGKVRTVVEEASKTFVDYAHKRYQKVLEDTNEVLWTSERDGWNHLYLFDLEDGSLNCQVTKGEWVVHSVERVEEDKRRVWIKVLGVVDGEDPYFSHLARVNLDGSDFQVLTKGDGSHTWQWSPDKSHFIDTWSRLDSPPETVLRDAETGKEVVGLETSRLDLLTSAGWNAPEPFAAPGRDGKTLVYGYLLHPTDLDKSSKYPVIEEIYAGPQDFYVPKSFSAFPKQRKRNADGYVAVMVDCMGTNWRSKAFHDVCHKNLADAGFPDRKAWLRAAAQTHPWIDLARIGCVGGSAGGQNAAGAVIFHGDFYKAACGYAGCHDNSIDMMWRSELWLGFPIDESYEKSSNVANAGKLTGKLMLGVGLMDTNVDPASTLKLVDALIEADKDFELVVVPSGAHHISGLPWVSRQLDKFFRKHLKDG